MMRRLGRRLALLMLVAAGAAQAQQPPQAGCPPAPQLPSAEQIQAFHARPRDRGFLWRVQRGGHVSYLYGTIHLGRAAWMFPGPQVQQALRASDTMALEIDVSDPAALAQAAAAVPKAGALPATLRERLARQVLAACLPVELLADQHPVMQLTTLSMMAARWDGLEPGFGQEFLLAGHARAAGMRLIALETPQRQIQALIPRDAGEASRLVARALDQLEQGQARRVMARLAAAWERGDLAALEDYEGWCECAATADERAMLARLNDARNPAMAERIAALHGEGRRVFAAVGALHMTGAQGLPRLLRERGFTVERVVFAP
jgi:uncharacterized protein YbaP (TraB family)